MKLPSLLFIALLAGCANQMTIGPRQLTQGFVETNIVAGVTSKTDVRRLLGKPGSVIMQSSSNPFMAAFMAPETWSYCRLDRFGGLTVSGSASTTLMLGFTNDIVSTVQFSQYGFGDTPESNPELKAALAGQGTNTAARSPKDTR